MRKLVVSFVSLLSVGHLFAQVGKSYEVTHEKRGDILSHSRVPTFVQPFSQENVDDEPGHSPPNFHTLWYSRREKVESICDAKTIWEMVFYVMYRYGTASAAFS